jgi:uncharacterized membrane protein YuzA (DUF378 family)
MKSGTLCVAPLFMGMHQNTYDLHRRLNFSYRRIRVRRRICTLRRTRYPPMVTKLITGLCIALLLAAFTPSAIRLYVIGSTTFGAAVPYELAMVAVGVATVLTAEVGQVVFSLALATLGTTTNARRLLYASMGIATAIALVGNVQVALPDLHNQRSERPACAERSSTPRL